MNDDLQRLWGKDRSVFLLATSLATEYWRINSESD